MNKSQQLSRCHHNITTNWHDPSPLVGSGFDIRSSDNALLAIMYGSLEHAAQFGWLNAGRTLVDKTYIHILWQAKRLPAKGITHHDIAPLLELFVRQHLEPIWPQLTRLGRDNRPNNHANKTAIELVSNAAATLFGSSYQEQAASWLLFYLCPQLPIFPVTDAVRSAIAARTSAPIEDYAGYQQMCSKLLHEIKPELKFPIAAAHYGSVKQIAMIDQLLCHSDWWLRHCFTMALPHRIEKTP